MSSIIFVLFIFHNGSGVAFQEFYSKQACENAKQEIDQLMIQYGGKRTICVSKSEYIQ